MTLSDAHRRHVVSGLDRLLSTLPRGRKLPARRLAELAAQHAGIDVVAGVAAFTPDSGGRDLPAGSWRRSGSQVTRGRLLRLTGPGGIRWHTAPVPAEPSPLVAFVFSLSLGNGAAFPQPTGTFAVEVEGRPVARFCVTKTARTWDGAGGLFGFQPLRVDATAFGNAFVVDDVVTSESLYADGYGVLVLPRESLRAGQPATVRIHAVDGEQPSRHWCRVSAGQPALYADDHLRAVRATLAPREPLSIGGHTLLFGDLHSHSGESHLLDGLPDGEGAEEPCGVGDRTSLFQYARDVAGLDFYCLSEHDWQMNDRDWKELQETNDAYLRGDFVTIHGYEWTSATYGHRNVYFADRPGPLLYSQDPRDEQNALPDDAPTPRDLWSHLREAGVPAITVPHHMSSAFFPLDTAAFHDDEFDRVAEIYSTWGDSLEHGQPVTIGAARLPELAFIEAVRRGVRSGFIGSSDSHDAHPGNAQGTPTRNHLFHHLGSGFAAVLLDQPGDAGRAGIFQALRRRRCYAATDTGTAVWLTVDGHPMGADATTRDTVHELELEVRASSPLAAVHIYRDGHPVERLDLTGRTRCQLTWRDEAPTTRTATSYFVKVVRQDFETAWTSPTWLRPA
ncbi:DUF3604 domain-containing protein [Phytohabitans sp. ZYX-F-186]|uniref:DUF3604 domain-containing protein n=1 Tax=Phytohabitans maris TaxID=3071409 RepID=A0ABU0ZB83_9ACTN|nr:DUF3604 domain-containing protein [Phytohabitans sp. ZYX-F-186]MDQ7903684.1 DUF3604 domain-containing protein [Phytohabitans sp. ZYX-F-186]